MFLMEWKMFSVEAYIILVEQEINAISKIERIMINMIVISGMLNMIIKFLIIKKFRLL